MYVNENEAKPDIPTRNPLSKWLTCCLNLKQTSVERLKLYLDVFSLKVKITNYKPWLFADNPVSFNFIRRGIKDLEKEDEVGNLWQSKRLIDVQCVLINLNFVD